MTNETPDHPTDSHPTPPADSALRITVESDDDFHERTTDKLAKIEAGETAPQDHVKSFATAAQVRRVLTDKRLELIEETMRDPPESITALADRLDREVSDVHDDLELLADEHIIQLDRNGRCVQPTVPYKRIHIDITLPRTPPADDRQAPA